MGFQLYEENGKLEEQNAFSLLDKLKDKQKFIKERDEREFANPLLRFQRLKAEDAERLAAIQAADSEFESAPEKLEEAPENSAVHSENTEEVVSADPKLESDPKSARDDVVEDIPEEHEQSSSADEGVFRVNGNKARDESAAETLAVGALCKCSFVRISAWGVIDI